MSKKDIAREEGKKNPMGKVALWIVLIIVAVIQIFPLIWLLDFSLASSTEMFTTGLLIWPEKLHFDNYVNAFQNGHVGSYLVHSLFINTLAVVCVLLFSVMMAFACSRMHWKLSKAVLGLIMLGMMIPIHATLLPNYVIYDRLHLTDTLFALLIPYVAFSLPQGLFLTVGFMSSIPKEIEEAAVIDGCGIFRIVFTIITPMLKSSLVTVSIDKDTDSMITGMAFHWYSGDHFEALQMAHEKYPGKKLLFSEGCVEYCKFADKDQLADARMYGHDIVGDLNNGACAFISWCLLLDEKGGPNHVDNFVDAPVMYDKNTDTMEKKLSYYYIGHFSRSILPGSVRIGCSKYTDKLESTAFLRPDGKLAVVLINRTDQKMPVYLRLKGEVLPVTVDGDAIMTVMVDHSDKE